MTLISNQFKERSIIIIWSWQWQRKWIEVNSMGLFRFLFVESGILDKGFRKVISRNISHKSIAMIHNAMSTIKTISALIVHYRQNRISDLFFFWSFSSLRPFLVTSVFSGSRNSDLLKIYKQNRVAEGPGKCPFIHFKGIGWIPHHLHPSIQFFVISFFFNLKKN